MPINIQGKELIKKKNKKNKSLALLINFSFILWFTVIATFCSFIYSWFTHLHKQAKLYKLETRKSPGRMRSTPMQVLGSLAIPSSRTGMHWKDMNLPIASLVTQYRRTPEPSSIKVPLSLSNWKFQTTLKSQFKCNSWIKKQASNTLDNFTSLN